jgi:hypothetical protein
MPPNCPLPNLDVADHRIDTMVNRLVAAMVVALGLLFAALHC